MHFFHWNVLYRWLCGSFVMKDASYQKTFQFCLKVSFVTNDPHSHLYKTFQWKKCIVGRPLYLLWDSIIFYVFKRQGLHSSNHFILSNLTETFFSLHISLLRYWGIKYRKLMQTTPTSSFTNNPTRSICKTAPNRVGNNISVPSSLTHSIAQITPSSFSSHQCTQLLIRLYTQHSMKQKYFPNNISGLAIRPESRTCLFFPVSCLNHDVNFWLFLIIIWQRDNKRQNSMPTENTTGRLFLARSPFELTTESPKMTKRNMQFECTLTSDCFRKSIWQLHICRQFNIYFDEVCLLST